MKIGGSTTGITYGAQTGEFYEQGNIVIGTFRILLTNKGAQTGALTITLPRVVGAYTTLSFIPTILGYANFSGLTGVLQAFINNSTSDFLTLLQSAAAGTSSVNETNITNTTDILISFFYVK